MLTRRVECSSIRAEQCAVCHWYNKRWTCNQKPVFHSVLDSFLVHVFGVPVCSTSDILCACVPVSLVVSIAFCMRTFFDGIVCVAFFPLSINVTKLGLMKGTHGLSLQTVNVLYKHCTPLRAQRIALDGVGSEWLAAWMKWLHRWSWACWNRFNSVFTLWYYLCSCHMHDDGQAVSAVCVYVEKRVRGNKKCPPFLYPLYRYIELP